jgi:4-carboxymuconolactone decarboxylase
MAEEPTPAEKMIGDFAPKLVELTDEVLFGEVWERPGLSPRDRSLITVTTLVALYRTDQLGLHLRRALESGLSEDELVEAMAITHMAFYAGWPNAMSAVTQLKTIVEDELGAQAGAK